MSRNLLQLQKGIIYGPINSRRLGSSLGVNLLPADFKACPFNCAYCQYGYTPIKGFITESNDIDFPSVSQVIDALTDALDEYPCVNYITFSGNGEPTIHPHFPEVVHEIKRVKSKIAPRAHLAILSNSAMVSKDNIRRALAELDDRFMKLDAGNEETFKKYNRPHRSVTFDSIIDGLKKLDSIVIQTLFTSGEHGNSSEKQISDWIDKIAEIKPLECHIYSIDRPFPDGKLKIIDKDGLNRIKDRAETQINIPVKVY